MKKNIIYMVIAATVFLLSACGSNSKTDPLVEATPPPGGYAFSNLTESIDVTSYNDYPIYFQLTQNGLTVPSAIVNMKVPDKGIGSIEKYTVTTDENGKGKFIYSPPDIFPVDGVLYMVYSDGNISLEEPIKITFNLATDIPSDGHATTLSIAYETTECNEKKGIIGHYHVHAVDRKSNRPAVNIPLNVTLVNGIKEINGVKVQKAKGSISNSGSIEFSDKSVDFYNQTKINDGDNLIIFATEEKTDTSYIGGWDIDYVYKYLLLNENYYNIVETNNLTYIIGNEKRLLGEDNANIGTIAVAHVEPNHVTDNDGYVYFDIVFDPILAGHTVTVEAHGNDDGNRIGAVQKVFLRLDNDSFSASDILISNTGGTRMVSVPLSINPSCTGNQPLIDVPVVPNSFQVSPQEHCFIDHSLGEYHSGPRGTVTVAVWTDGNTSETGGEDTCTLTWDGGPSSLSYEY